tara:strand:+ start:4659 stop:5879 length:1221 start_codon:yes stop_codon:yes gene_type:complete
MKNSIELKELRSDVIVSLEVIKDIATMEDRDLTQEENTKVDNLLSEVDVLDTKIERAEKMETIKRNTAGVSGTTAKKEDKDLEKFTFQEAMRQAYTGNGLTGIVKEMDEEARSESRYTGQNFKGVGIPSSILTRANISTADVNSVDTMSFTDQLEKNLVLSSAGANFYAGVNNLKFPVFSAIDSAWVSEDGSSGSASANGTSSAVTLTPKKLVSIVKMSQESFVQNAGLESALTRNMARQMAAALEFALLDTGDVTNAPQSIFADATAGPTAVTAADWVEMETDALAAGVHREGSRLAYLLDMDAYKTVKTLAQVASVSPLYDNFDRRLNGYYAFQSANVADAGTASKAHALFGDFSKVHIAQFGGLDMLYDPYSNASTGMPQMVVTGLFDGDAVQNSSFIKLIEA